MILFFSKTTFIISKKRILKNWLHDLVYLEKKKTGDINIIFCNDDQLSLINKQYLSHDTLTDIITFDYSEKNILSGDIFISTERVKENAVKYKYCFDEELRRVMAHGFFHLCGYKDRKTSDKLLMKQKEEEALILFNTKYNY